MSSYEDEHGNDADEKTQPAALEEAEKDLKLSLISGMDGDAAAKEAGVPRLIEYFERRLSLATNKQQQQPGNAGTPSQVHDILSAAKYRIEQLERRSNEAEVTPGT